MTKGMSPMVFFTPAFPYCDWVVNGLFARAGPCMMTLALRDFEGPVGMRGAWMTGVGSPLVLTRRLNGGVTAVSRLLEKVSGLGEGTM